MSAVRTNDEQRSAQLSRDNLAPHEAFNEEAWSDDAIAELISEVGLTHTFLTDAVYAARNQDIGYLVRKYGSHVIPAMQAEAQA